MMRNKIATTLATVILNLSFSHKNLTIGREIKVIIEAIIKYPMIILIFISIYPIIKIDIK
jgi:hypothetical protein